MTSTNFETMATLRKASLFELRKYIANNYTEAVEPATIRTHADCIAFIEAKELFTKTGSTRPSNGKAAEIKHALQFNRDFTIASLRALVKGFNAVDNDGNVKGTYTADNLEFKAATHITSAGGRIPVTFNGRCVMTLFYGLKGCNVTVRENDFESYLEFIGVDRETFNALHEVGTLSYNQPVYLHNFTYEKVTETPKTDADGNEILNEDGLPVYDMAIEHGNLITFVVKYLEMFGALIYEEAPTEEPTTEEAPTETKPKGKGKAKDTSKAKAK